MIPTLAENKSRQKVYGSIHITKDDRKETKEMNNHLWKGLQETGDSKDKWKKGYSKIKRRIGEERYYDDKRGHRLLLQYCKEETK